MDALAAQTLKDGWLCGGTSLGLPLLRPTRNRLLLVPTLAQLPLGLTMDLLLQEPSQLGGPRAYPAAGLRVPRWTTASAL